MSRQNNRRDFLKGSAAAGVGFWVAGKTAIAQSNSAIEQINFACIGVGGKGRSDSGDAGNHGNVIAICDVDDNTLNKAAANPKFKNPQKFNDYREMLDKLGDKIDAVTVSTPDHTHAPAAIKALKMGKHVFCQKPLTHTVFEARQMATLAKEKGVATQMGNQGTAGSGLREAAAMIKAGVLGKIKEVHVWTNRPIWAQGGPRPAPEAVPGNLHWDLWLGAAPERPFAKGYHPFSWRGWWDFGTGALGDMACHTFNLPYMACDLYDPTSIEAKSSGHNKDSYPKWSEITFMFPATDKRPACPVTWYDGGRKPPQEQLLGEGMKNSGALIVGDQGTLYSGGDYGGSYTLLPKGKIEKIEVEYPRSPGHFTEWANAIKGGPPAMSNFADYSGGLTETILLGNLAVWADKKIEWDAKNLRATNAPEVAKIVNKDYRVGFGI